MKRFSIGSLFVVIALVATVGACLVALRSNRLLHSELAGLHETIEQTESMVDYQLQLLADARLGSTLLYRMALSEEYDEVFDFLRTIPADSLSCRTMEFPEYPSVKMISFHHHRQGPDGTVLPLDECKSASILVKSGSLDVIEYNLHKGFSTINASSVAPFYVLCRDLPDGSSVKYTILPTGFERSN